MWHLKFLNFLRLAWKEAHEKDGYIFTQYFENLFKLSFFMLLSPFRLVRNRQDNGNMHHVTKSYIIHKILVGLIQAAVFIDFFIYIKFDFHPSEIKKDPSLMFDYFETICIWLFSGLWVILLWRGPRIVEAVLALTPPNTSGGCEMDPKRRRMNRWKLRAVILACLLFVLPKEALMFQGYWHHLIRPDGGRLQALIEGETLTNAGYSLAVLLMVLNAFAIFIIIFARSVVIISIFAVKEIVDAAKCGVRLEGKVIKNVEDLLRMREQIQTVNSLSGTVLVVMLVEIVGHVAGLIGESAEDDLLETFLDTMLHVVYGVCLFFAAEAEFQARKLTRSVLHNAATAQVSKEFKKCNEFATDIQTLKIMLHSSPGTNGLVGWKFFQISYGFLGACVSITLTYALVMLQFVATPPKPNDEGAGKS